MLENADKGTMQEINQREVLFRMHPDGWILLLLCLLIGVATGGLRMGFFIGVFLVLSLLLHELGHATMAMLLRVRVSEIGLRLKGAYIRRARSGHPYDEALIAFAGPMANFCLVVLFLYMPWIGHHLAVGNLAIGAVNLLPIPASDGKRIWNALLGM